MEEKISKKTEPANWRLTPTFLIASATPSTALKFPRLSSHFSVGEIDAVEGIALAKSGGNDPWGRQLASSDLYNE